MKKAAVIFLVIGGFVVVVWIIARLTHTLEIYNIPTTSSEPTYKPGSTIIASRFKKPDNNSFIVFRRPDKSAWIFRCIGKEGDIIEIKNAAVYLNGKLLNEPYAWNEYYISKSQLANIAGYVDKNHNPVNPINDSLFTITLSTAELKEYRLNLKPHIDTIEPNIFSDFKKLGYNEDNLGPIKVPKDSFFVLGDNRHDAFDSRYFGFIKSGDIISTVIR